MLPRIHLALGGESVTEQTQRCLLDVQISTDTRLSDFASESPTMQSFMRTVWRVMQADSSLLILRETGVGKERLARVIREE